MGFALSIGACRKVFSLPTQCVGKAEYVFVPRLHTVVLRLRTFVRRRGTRVRRQHTLTLGIQA